MRSRSIELQGVAAKALEAAGQVADPEAEHEAGVGAPPAAIACLSRLQVAHAPAGDVAGAQHEVGLPGRRDQAGQVGRVVREVRIHLQDQLVLLPSTGPNPAT